MKTEDLIALGLTQEIADKVFALHGKDIETHKANVTTLQTELDTAKTQLTEAGTTIESFKAMKPDELKAAADDYKAKFEQATTEAQKQMTALKFDHALESALASAKAKNPKAVSALLSKDALKFNEADGSIIGLKEQLEAIQKDNDYLFVSDAPPPPVIVKGGNSQSVLGNTFADAARRGAKLPEPK